MDELTEKTKHDLYQFIRDSFPNDSVEFDSSKGSIEIIFNGKTLENRPIHLEVIYTLTDLAASRSHEKNEYYQIILEDIKREITQQNKNLDCFTPLDEMEWESMTIDSAVAFLNDPKEYKNTIAELQHHNLRMSQEIRRLRHKCNESVWYDYDSTPEMQAEEKRRCKNT